MLVVVVGKVDVMVVVVVGVMVVVMVVKVAVVVVIMGKLWWWLFKLIVVPYSQVVRPDRPPGTAGSPRR